jgi:acyl-CoA dehydrogenase
MIFLLLLIVLIVLLVHFRANLITWTVGLAVLSGLWMFFGRMYNGTGWWIACSFLLVVAVVLNLPGIRRAVLIKPVYLLFRRMLPPISKTEREALEAGTVWWDGELFTGDPDWNRLFGTPKPLLNEEEQSFLDNQVEELCRMLDDHAIAREQDLPPEVWRFIREKGFFGMIIPKEYGGLGFSTLGHSQVVMKVASRSVPAAVTVMVPNSLGPAELLLHYGTGEQKKHYLPRLATGEEIPCLALTGPEAGSDAASMPDTGVVCRGNFQGEEIVGIKLNWEKRYITLGPVATLLGLAFRLRDPEHILGGDTEPGLTMALIPTDTPGISIGSRHDPLNIPFQNGPNRGKDVFIPLEWVVGGRSGIGLGWQMLMESLAAGRSVSMPALSTGVGKFLFRVVGAYARVRRQFRIPIGRFEGVEEVLARIAGNIYRMDAVRTLTCSAVDLGERPSVLSAAIKYYCTEQMRKSVNDGMDIAGGSGICLGPSNILTRSMIIFGQGAVRCHPYLLKEMQAVANPDAGQGLKEFDRFLRNHISFVHRNVLHAFIFGLTGGRFAKVPALSTRRYCRIIRRLSAAFALTTDVVLLTLGGGLKRRERISARLADILIHLYLLSALLKQFEDRRSPSDEWPLLRYGVQESLHAIQESFRELFQNLPNRPAAWLLRLTAFPFGFRFLRPDDRLGARVARISMEPSELRDRLSDGAFIPSDISDPLGRLEDALKKVSAAEPVEQKLRNAVRKGLLAKEGSGSYAEEGALKGIITGDEADILQSAEEARRDVIQVDDFPKR